MRILLIAIGLWLLANITVYITNLVFSNMITGTIAFIAFIMLCFTWLIKLVK
jgi:hypothetical protein